MNSLTKPTEPELVALTLNLLSRFSKNVTEKTPLDTMLEHIASGSADSRQAAQRVVKRFESFSPESRNKAFGNLLANATSISISGNQLNGLKTTLGKRLNLANDDVDISLGDIHPAPPATYFLEYKGLFCKSETTWDGFSNSDEIYIVSSVVAIDPFKVNAVPVVKTTKQPLTKSHYSDVDSGEARMGPENICWSGPANNLSLIVTVLEQDDDDPESHKKEIDMIVKAAVTTIKYFTGVELNKGLLQQIVSYFVHWILGGADDVISEEYSVLSWHDVISHSTSMLKKEPGFGSVPHHFKTIHRGGGAEYHVMFGCRFV